MVRPHAKCGEVTVGEGSLESNTFTLTPQWLGLALCETLFIVCIVTVVVDRDTIMEQ